MALVSVHTAGSLVPGFEKQVQALQAELRRLNIAGAKRTRRLWRRNVERRSGRLARHGSITITGGGANVTLTIDPPHMDPRWVEEGTRPHTIVPRRPGGVLAFEVGGVKVFTKRVRHPGYKGTHTLRKAEQVNERLLRAEMARAARTKRMY